MTQTEIELTSPLMQGSWKFYLYMFGEYDNYHCVLEDIVGTFISAWDDSETASIARGRAVSLAKDHVASRVGLSMEHRFNAELT